MRRFLASTVQCRRRGLSTAAALPRLVVRATPSSSRLPPNVHIFGGTDTERRSLEARLARVLHKSPLLQQESIGVVILGDTFTAPEEAASSADQQPAGARPAVASSSPLAESFLAGDFPPTGSLLTVFHVGERDRAQLVATQGEDVLDAWAKDTLRRHLASMGGIIEARHPLVLEPALLDLSSETEALEDDEELAWSLSKKMPLAAAAVPGSYFPPRYLNPPGRMVCLVFPHREVKSTEWLHRMQRQLVDYARKHLVPTQTHFLALDKATSTDPAVREAEARRFCEMARRLPPGTLILGEEAALDVLVEWTGRLNGGQGSGSSTSNGKVTRRSGSSNGSNGSNGHGHANGGCGGLGHQVTSYNLALTNYLFKSPSDVMAGPRLLGSLSARSNILVAYHNPNALSTAKAKQQAELRGERIVAVLSRLFEERAKGNPGLKPQIEAGSLKDHASDLHSYTLLVLHSGSHAVDDEAVKEVLTAANDAGVPVITPGLLRAWFRSPRTVAAALKPWPPSFSFLGDGSSAGAFGQEEGGVGVVGSGREEVWDHGYRKKSFDCSECESWACGPCTQHQQQYARRLGEQHKREIGQEWRELF